MEFKVFSQKLDKYKNFDEQPENCEKFLEVLEEIVLKNDPNCITILIHYLTEIKDADWVREIILNNILHYIEKYEKSREILAGELKLMVSLIPEWCETLCSIFLNEKKNIEKFLEILKKQDKDTVQLLVTMIKSESPYHAELLKELQLKLNKSD